MSNYSALKATIDATIKTNGKQEITGAIMNSALKAMIDSLGKGYQFVGVATPTTNPGTPDQNIFYVAFEKGIYSNFGGIELQSAEIGVFKYNGTWTNIVSKVVDIIDNLVDGGTDKVLSAEQGKILSRQIMAGDELLQNQIDSIHPQVIEGNVTNAPDQEDLTSVNDLLKFKNRDATLNTKGYYYVRKGDNVKTLLENKPNTIFEIRYNFDLAGATIDIADGIILKFVGGKFSNGVLHGNFTGLIWDGKNVIFDDGLKIVGYENPNDESDVWGQWICPYISTRMFGDYIHTDDNILKWGVFCLNYSKIQTTVEICDGDYYVNRQSGRFLLPIKSNTNYIINGQIILKNPDAEPIYEILDITKQHNISICGNGVIVGDEDAAMPEATSEYGNGISITGSENINIKGLTIKNCWGDGILVGGLNISKNITIDGCEIYSCRRQGISITYADIWKIANCFIHDIIGTNPQFCIDIEPDNSSGLLKYAHNGIIENNKMTSYNGVSRVLLITGDGAKLTDNPIENIVVRNNDCYGINSVAQPVDGYYTICASKRCKRLVFYDNKFNGGYVAFNGEMVFRNNQFDVANICPVGTNMDIRLYNNVINTLDFYGYFSGKIVLDGNVINSGITMGGDDIEIANNLISAQRDISGWGLITLAGGKKYLLRNNTIKDNGYTITYGIRLSGKIDDVIVEDNIFETNISEFIRLMSNAEGKLVISNNRFNPQQGLSVHPAAIMSVIINDNQWESFGTTANRPMVAASWVGYKYYDTTIGKPIWWDGNNWKDSAGNTI